MTEPDKKELKKAFKAATGKGKEFSFDDNENVGKDLHPEPPKPEPDKSKLNPDDLKFEPYRGIDGTGRRISIESDDDDGTDIPLGDDDEALSDDDMFELEQEMRAEQERTFDAAGHMLPRRREIRDALENVSNLSMADVITAGIIEETYRGRMPDARVDAMTAAALLMDADNFDDITGLFQPETVGMVDEMHRMMMAPEEDVRLLELGGMEPDTKRLFLANTAAGMEMTKYEMKEYGDAGPEKEEHEALAKFIVAAAKEDLDQRIVNRAIKSFNEVSEMCGHGTTIKQLAGGELVINDQPDIVVKVDKPETEKPAQRAEGTAKPAPKKNNKKR
ncbi:MAG: hypothetical protein ACAH80_09505 [Alphaproteobacteria bacterium]